MTYSDMFGVAACSSVIFLTGAAAGYALRSVLAYLGDPQCSRSNVPSHCS